MMAFTWHCSKKTNNLHMKKSLIFILFVNLSFSQIPQDYYNTAVGSGYALKSQLANIISSGHEDQGYDLLYTAYETTHTDNISVNGFENDGTVLDFYSENPNGQDPYNYNHGQRQCGNYSDEDFCYNREHIIPQSVYNKAYPMRSDVHHVIPTDGYVNNRRGSYPFGEVSPSNYDWKSQNNSRLGPNTFGNYSGIVFEPIDEFKGDIARALLYFAVRYENQIASWEHPMFNGTSKQVFSDWFLELILDWHYNVDPVDSRELARNQAAYNFQGNANPFVDHPEYANMIWNPASDVTPPSIPGNVYLNNVTSSSITINWDPSSDNIGVSSYEVYNNNTLINETSSTSYVAFNLESSSQYCFKIKAKDAAANTSEFSNDVCENTLDSGGNPDDCMNESFNNLESGSSSYSNRIWTGDLGGEWNASDARTDQSLNGNAITIRNGSLEAPTGDNGISNFNVSTKRVFSGGIGTFDLYINDIFINTIPYSTDEQIVTISNINIEGSVSLEIKNNSDSGNRVIFDNLNWSCYEPLGYENNLEDISIYPNPVKENILYINGITNAKIEFFDPKGTLVLKSYMDKKNKKINTAHLNKGVYFLKIKNTTNSKSIKLVID